MVHYHLEESPLIPSFVPVMNVNTTIEVHTEEGKK